MSELNDLITKLCPDGVPYKKLLDVADVLYGAPFNAKQFNNDSEGMPLIRIRDIMRGYTETFYTGEYDDKYIIHEGDILIGMDGDFNIGKWKSDDALLNQRTLKIKHGETNEVIDGYLYHLLGPILKGVNDKIQASTVKHLTAQWMKRIEIPVPPIEVQHEVVRILDAFTELEAELEAELAGRIEQYEYFRYYLLDEKNLERIDGEPVETKKLGDIVDILDSKRKPVNRGSRVSGKYPYYGANGVQDYINDYLFDGEFLLVGEDGSVITDKGTPILNWANGKIWVNNHAHVLQEKADEQYMLRYIKYALECKNIARLIHGAIPKLNQQTLKSIEIPVPSLSTQKRIVDILDRFDTLTTSLTDGIPAEIAMRREQYEYFRSRILDFPRLPDSSVSDGE